MLGFIRGTVLSKNVESRQLIVLMHRLGFEVTVPQRLFDSVQPKDSILLWVHTHVREDVLSLFGFTSEMEKQLFRVLIGVSGLGPRTALSLLDQHGGQKLVQLIIAKKNMEIAEAPGVGKKLAERLALELSGKLEKRAWLESVTQSPPCALRQPIPEGGELRNDLISALSHLGYQTSQIKSVIDKLLERDQGEGFGFELCLKRALSELSGRPHRAAGEGTHG